MNWCIFRFHICDAYLQISRCALGMGACERFLHAAPSDLMKAGEFEEQCAYSVTGDVDDRTKKTLARNHRRVTFLVNVWLNYKPFNVSPFPNTMIDKQSDVNLFGGTSLFPDCKKRSHGDDGTRHICANDISTVNVVVREGKALLLSDVTRQQVPSPSLEGNCDDGGGSGTTVTVPS